MGHPLGRNARRLRRCMLVRQRLPRRMHRLNNRLPQTASFECPGLRRCRAKTCCGDGRQASATLGEKHATKNLHELPTNAGVKRRPEWAVRLDEMLDGCDAACSCDNDCHEECTA